MAYIGNSPDNIQRGRRFIYEFTASAGQTVFSGTDDNNQTLDLLEANEQSVFLNGVRLIPTDDYTVSGDVLTLTSAASLNDFLVVETQAEIVNISTYTRAESDARYVNYNGDIISGDLQVVGNVSVSSGDISLGDNDKINIGASNDLQLYNDGSHSYIDEQGTGSLQIRGTNLNLKSSTNETYLYCVANGEVGLQYDNALKLATTSTGVDITGTASVDNLLVDNAGKIYSLGQIELQVDADNNQTGTYIGFSRNNTTSERLALFQENGDISFYEATGTTQKFFWDASAESLGIGTSSPSRVAELYNTSNPALRINNGTDIADIGLASSAGAFATSSTSGALVIARNGANDINFATNGTNRMTIDSSGNLLVGTTSTSWTNTDGLRWFSGGSLISTLSGGPPAYFNRRTNDGNIAVFTKDGTTVGSIGNASSDLEIYTPNQSGIALKGNNVSPMYQGDQSDNQTDLGRSANRWRDLYLSGGVYVGGTGSANYLDDYESGTWTPVFRGGTSAGSYTYGEQQGHYIKIGDQVTAWCNLTNIATTTAGSGIIQISGLPFAANWMSGFNGDAIGSFSVNGFTGLDGDYIMVVVPDNTSSIFLYKQTGTNNDTAVINVTDKVGSGSDCRGFVTYYVGG